MPHQIPESYESRGMRRICAAVIIPSAASADGFPDLRAIAVFGSDFMLSFLSLAAVIACVCHHGSK